MLVRLTVTVPLKMGPVEVTGEELPPHPVRICVRPKAATAKASMRNFLLRMRRRRANGSSSDGRKSPARTMLDGVVCSWARTAVVVMVRVDVSVAPLPVAVRVVGLKAQVAEVGRPVQVKVLKVPV